jgi:hypothetical protein
MHGTVHAYEDGSRQKCVPADPVEVRVPVGAAPSMAHAVVSISNMARRRVSQDSRLQLGHP